MGGSNYIEYESKGERNKTLSLEVYLNKIRPYLKDIKDNLRKSERWKSQLTIENYSISSADNNEECVIHSKSYNREVMINDEELLKSLNRYQNNFELMKGGEFVFDYVHLLYYKCHKINLNHGGLYIDYT